MKKYLKAFRDGDLIKALSELDNLSKINKQMKDFSYLMRERITELQITGLQKIGKVFMKLHQIMHGS